MKREEDKRHYGQTRISENSRLVLIDYLSHKSENSLIVSFVAGGISTITKEWILCGMETTPEDLTAEIVEIMDLLIKDRVNTDIIGQGF